MLVGPSKQLKQIIQIDHNIVKNPNRPEADQLATNGIADGSKNVLRVNRQCFHAVHHEIASTSQKSRHYLE